MEAIGQLTGGVAHDFNNLLAVISSGVDILHTLQLAGAGTRVLEGMRRAVDRGALLTQQLLSFARQQPLAPTVHHLNTLISGFEAVLRRAAGPLVRFELNLGSQLAQVSVDEARFEAALLNLVVNARDAMPDGGSLIVETRNATLVANEVGTLPVGEYVKVTVRDTGIGMPQDVRSRAFEPFFTTKEAGKGTGLGLSQVYGFIVQSGGDVAIDTEEGFGTSIRLYLPVHEGAPGRATETSEAPREERVLIVEDDQLLMAVAGELFQTMGYTVLSASDGLEALRVLQREQHIDVMFSDVMMPNGMTGLDLAREVSKRYPDIKIILASGYPLPALQSEQRGLSEFSFVSKPYRMADIARHLRS
jgi:CheY-like chemotaxis protein